MNQEQKVYFFQTISKVPKELSCIWVLLQDMKAAQQLCVTSFGFQLSKGQKLCNGMFYLKSLGVSVSACPWSCKISYIPNL